MRRKINLRVCLEYDDSIEGSVELADVKEHVRVAAQQWGGQLDDNHWNWPGHIKVTVRSAREKD